jgi:hypothetical protein
LEPDLPFRKTRLALNTGSNDADFDHGPKPAISLNPQNLKIPSVTRLYPMPFPGCQAFGPLVALMPDAGVGLRRNYCFAGASAFKPRE